MSRMNKNRMFGKSRSGTGFEKRKLPLRPGDPGYKKTSLKGK